MARVLVRKRYLHVYKGPSLYLKWGPNLSYAEKNGYAVLRGETSLRKVNGICLNTRWFSAWILFRRASIGG